MSRIRVLVADDHGPTRELLTAALAEHFAVLPPAANGRQLVDEALRQFPDVVVSDVHMPVLGGVAAMRLLRRLGCMVPFVMISADADVGPDCLDAGAAAFVGKEVAGRELVPTIRDVAETQPARSRLAADLRESSGPAVFPFDRAGRYPRSK